jgi:hypothetical protein
MLCKISILQSNFQLSLGNVFDEISGCTFMNCIYLISLFYPRGLIGKALGRVACQMFLLSATPKLFAFNLRKGRLAHGTERLLTNPLSCLRPLSQNSYNPIFKSEKIDRE